MPALVGLVALVLAVSSCTFERRGNEEDEPSETEPNAQEGDSVVVSADPSEVVLDAVRTFREATMVGDLALALALIDREASFSDELAGGGLEGRTRGELLLELRSRLGAGMELREESSEVLLSDDVAVVVSRLVLEGRDDPGEDAADADPRRLDETVVLVPVAGGWRIRHLHRSIAPDA